jgi:hypothetical protein
MVKVLTILFFPVAYFGLLVFGPWYAHIPAQTALLVVFLAFEAWRRGVKNALRTLWIIVPFVLSLLLFGGIFQWLELMGRTDWIQDSLIKGLVFPNSFLVVKLSLDSITFRDLVRLPLRPRARRIVIVIKAVMEKSSPVLKRYRFFMGLSPHFENRRMGSFLRICAVMVAAYISIYRQTEQTKTLYDHRRRHLRDATDVKQ